MTTVETEAPTAAMSGMDRIRQARADAAKITTVDLPIPGYGGQLVARYRLLDPLVEGQKIVARVKQQFKTDAQQAFYGLVDTLVEACEGLYEPTDDGTLQPLALDPTGEPISYGKQLADGLGINGGDPFEVRNVVIGLFTAGNPNGNKIAVTAHALQLQEWMSDPAGFSPGEA